MITLEENDIFDIIGEQLRKFYPKFKDRGLVLDYTFDTNYAYYDFRTRKLHFNNKVLYFEFQGDYRRFITFQEIAGLLKKVYSDAKVKLELYIYSDYGLSENKDKYKELVTFKAEIDQDNVELNTEQLHSLIDLALDTRSKTCDNKEWLTELSLRYQPFLKANS